MNSMEKKKKITIGEKNRKTIANYNCLSSVTFVHCGQTAIDRLMISSQADRSAIWLHKTTTSIEIGQTVFEQWRT